MMICFQCQNVIGEELSAQLTEQGWQCSECYSKEDVSTLVQDLSRVLNGQENASNTPDFLLAEYLMGCLDIYTKTIRARAKWHRGGIMGVEDKTGGDDQPYAAEPGKKALHLGGEL